jgi:hypothetical protein
VGMRIRQQIILLASRLWMLPLEPHSPVRTEPKSPSRSVLARRCIVA